MFNEIIGKRLDNFRGFILTPNVNNSQTIQSRSSRTDSILGGDGRAQLERTKKEILICEKWGPLLSSHDRVVQKMELESKITAKEKTLVSCLVVWQMKNEMCATKILSVISVVAATMLNDLHRLMVITLIFTMKLCNAATVPCSLRDQGRLLWRPL